MIKVLIVDDSLLKQNFIISVLAECSDIVVIGTALNGKQAIEKCKQLKPDVITMDINMPVMNGLEAIEYIMKNCPTVIIAVTSADDNTIKECLNNGVIDFFSLKGPYQQKSSELIGKIITASKVRVMRKYITLKKSEKKSIKTYPSATVFSDAVDKSKLTSVIAVGTSTGGPYALERFLESLDPHRLKAGILIVQHISLGFIHGLSEWLNAKSSFNVVVPKEGDILEDGKVFLAPEQFLMEIDRNGIIHLRSDEKNEYLFVPSVDAMMKSVAHSFSDKAVGIIMTGMGYDGVEGIKAIKDCGGTTIAQDEKTSVIFGMNRAAIEKGVIDKVISIDDIGRAVTDL
jgi:two-component system, chemotaxis family, protein-glutamate methylesterase/glutaminase